MALSDDDVRKLALLARLELSTDEVQQIRPQLQSILGFVEQLSELDVEGVEPMTTALEVDNRWRVDVVEKGLSNEEALRNAPASEEGLFLVPPVLGPSASKQ